MHIIRSQYSRIFLNHKYLQLHMELSELTVEQVPTASVPLSSSSRMKDLCSQLQKMESELKKPEIAEGGCTIQIDLLPVMVQFLKEADTAPSQETLPALNSMMRIAKTKGVLAGSAMAAQTEDIINLMVSLVLNEKDETLLIAELPLIQSLIQEKKEYVNTTLEKIKNLTSFNPPNLNTFKMLVNCIHLLNYLSSSKIFFHHLQKGDLLKNIARQLVNKESLLQARKCPTLLDYYYKAVYFALQISKEAQLQLFRFPYYCELRKYSTTVDNLYLAAIIYTSKAEQRVKVNRHQRGTLFDIFSIYFTQKCVSISDANYTNMLAEEINQLLNTNEQKKSKECSLLLGNFTAGGKIYNDLLIGALLHLIQSCNNQLAVKRCKKILQNSLLTLPISIQYISLILDVLNKDTIQDLLKTNFDKILKWVIALSQDQNYSEIVSKFQKNYSHLIIQLLDSISKNLDKNLFDVICDSMFLKLVFSQQFMAKKQIFLLTTNIVNRLFIQIKVVPSFGKQALKAIQHYLKWNLQSEIKLQLMTLSAFLVEYSREYCNILIGYGIVEYCLRGFGAQRPDLLAKSIQLAGSLLRYDQNLQVFGKLAAGGLAHILAQSISVYIQEDRGVFESAIFLARRLMLHNPEKLEIRNVLRAVAESLHRKLPENDELLREFRLYQ